MPIYEYECRACFKRSEFFQSITAGHKRKCPHCGHLKLERQMPSGVVGVTAGNDPRVKHARYFYKHDTPKDRDEMNARIKAEGQEWLGVRDIKDSMSGPERARGSGAEAVGNVIASARKKMKKENV